ncbi:MAG: hypothetical protein ACRDFS_06270 [Chloroflexota bacterium]
MIEIMVALVIVALFVLVGPLAILFGADSRVSDLDDRRSWIPARRVAAHHALPGSPTGRTPIALTAARRVDGPSSGSAA